MNAKLSNETGQDAKEPHAVPEGLLRQFLKPFHADGGPLRLELDDKFSRFPLSTVQVVNENSTQREGDVGPTPASARRRAPPRSPPMMTNTEGEESVEIRRSSDAASARIVDVL
eukprot:CAMPEP_0183320098 /NCGR_PEP_ID=MMETSP0160_2-20130417/65372_1 /TAXON_ID=2839 ORGANISM="Odontella Sinensis, Strain Grunow 1884" /NCGR_SAMPLE_ID=MMETSP0160_2 /ASSEMBLY_ACC=CAM_ASM_000250 /LENGTH=113 /DNA_ID=CAMNT_0025486717 /DNA_START=297 /DNA_END=639 /DNA_ORIENTATION=+